MFTCTLRMYVLYVQNNRKLTTNLFCRFVRTAVKLNKIFSLRRSNLLSLVTYIPIIIINIIMFEIDSRDDLHKAQRIVLKAGTSVVSNPDGFPSLTRIANIVESASRLAHEGKQVMLVTSGNIYSWYE